MPSKLRLPPLPPKRWMKKFFPALVASRMLALSHFRAKGRLNIIDRELCNRAVRAIKLRPNEIVIDCFSGPGQMTRALLSGGKTDVEEEAAIKRSWLEATEKASVKPGTTKQNQPAELATFPSWARTFDPEGGYDQDFPTREPEVVEGEVVKPKLVVACEPANGLLQRAHNVSLSWLEHAKWWLKNNMVPHNAYDTLPDIVAKSEYEDNLLLSVGNPYDWTILPLILSHPLVGAQRRAFDAEAPAITIVAEIPHSDTGEQMIQQWVASAASARTGEASWIWEFGRVRMVWFIENRIYDKLCAQPGEFCYSKVAIIARALYKITPIPPYHHIPNATKVQNYATATQFGQNQSSQVCIDLATKYAAEVGTLERTKTWSDDYWPEKRGGGTVIRNRGEPVSPAEKKRHAKERRVREAVGLPEIVDTLELGPEFKEGKYHATPVLRPHSLGIMLEPRLDSPITAENVDAWEYVLRKAYVKQARPLSEGVGGLGFGAESLMPAIERDEKGVFKGANAPADTLVRDMTEEQWARVVDVFMDWPFKPESLIDVGVDVDTEHDG